MKRTVFCVLLSLFVSFSIFGQSFGDIIGLPSWLKPEMTRDEVEPYVVNFDYDSTVFRVGPDVLTVVYVAYSDIVYNYVFGEKDKKFKFLEIILTNKEAFEPPVGTLEAAFMFSQKYGEPYSGDLENNVYIWRLGMRDTPNIRIILTISDIDFDGKKCCCVKWEWQ